MYMICDYEQPSMMHTFYNGNTLCVLNKDTILCSTMITIGAAYVISKEDFNFNINSL